MCQKLRFDLGVYQKKNGPFHILSANLIIRGAYTYKSHSTLLWKYPILESFSKEVGKRGKFCLKCCDIDFSWVGV